MPPKSSLIYILALFPAVCKFVNCWVDLQYAQLVLIIQGVPKKVPSIEIRPFVLNVRCDTIGN